MRFSLKLIGFIPILFLLCSVASAVTVPSNITINLTDVNLTVDNLTFDSVVIGNDSIAFNESGSWANFTVVPDNPINITIVSWNVTGDCQKSWNKTGDAAVNYAISGLPTNRYIRVISTNNTVELLANSLGLITFNSEDNSTFNVRLSTYSSHEEEDKAQVEEIRDSFVNSWGNTVSMVGAIIIIALAGSMLAVFRGKRDISDVVKDLPGIVLIVVLLVVGAIIFGQF